MITHVTIDFGAKAYYAAVAKRGLTENPGRKSSEAMRNGNLKQLHEADPRSWKAAVTTYGFFSDLLRKCRQSPKNIVIVNVTNVNF